MLMFIQCLNENTSLVSQTKAFHKFELCHLPDRMEGERRKETDDESMACDRPLVFSHCLPININENGKFSG